MSLLWWLISDQGTMFLKSAGSCLLVGMLIWSYVEIKKEGHK